VNSLCVQWRLVTCTAQLQVKLTTIDVTDNMSSVHVMTEDSRHCLTTRNTQVTAIHTAIANHHRQ